MVSLFPLSTQSTLSAVLQKLQPDTPPEWGIMYAQQMIEHLDIIIRYTFSGEQVPVFTPVEQVEKVKQFLWSDKPFPRLFRNPVMGDVVVKHIIGLSWRAVTRYPPVADPASLLWDRVRKASPHTSHSAA